MRQLLSSILFTTLIATALEAQTIRKVPQNFPTIQDAIVAAQNGDTVQVAPGVYVERINFLGKAITVVSIAGADVTTIDGNQGGTVVTMTSGEGPNSVIDGFTIRNGRTPNANGGGIEITGSPTIRHNHIVNNISCLGTGGISILSGAPIIQGNLISNNHTAGCGNGGIGGGGIYISGQGPAQILDNTISNNEDRNSSTSSGGITVFAASQALIRNNIITGNIGIQGGGIQILGGSSVTIDQNLIAGNTASNGGGIYWLNPGGLTSVTNNTIADNVVLPQGSVVPPQGSAIYADGADGTVPVKNNIIIGKTGQAAIYCGNSNDTNPPILAFNDVFVDLAAAYSGFCSDATGTNGNISAAPLFVDRASQNYRLSTGSAGIDAGTNAVVGIPLDLSSFPRIFPAGGTVDMGAYEFVTATTSTISTTNLAFSDQSAGTVSAPLNVTLTNNGTETLLVSSVVVSGDFSQTNTCQAPTGISSGQNCTISVLFAPNAGGPRSGQLVITSNSAIANVSLSGNGTGSFSLSADPLTFVDQKTGTTGPATALIVSNTGTTDLSISSIAVTGDFTSSNDCPATIPAGAFCTISVRFAPTARGIRPGAVSIIAPGNVYLVSLTGRGLSPLIDFSPTSLTFPNTAPGSTSALQNVTLSNPGDIALGISSISIIGEFTESNDCGTSLAVNATCNVSVAFAPAGIGFRSGSIRVIDDAPGSPHISGLFSPNDGGFLTSAPAGINFGNWALNFTNSSGSITLRNAGNATLTVSNISISGDFAKIGSCATLLQNSTCTLTVTFTPTSLGLRTGALTFTSNGIGSPLVVPLSGTGTEKFPIKPRDFNGDGKSDILWRDTTGKVSAWQMNGFAVTSDTLIANIWPDWKIVGTGDFDADGKMDILWRDSFGSVAVWLMNGSSISSYSVAGNMPVSWTVAAVADFNADGKADILWRNISGDVAIWQMNGATISSSTVIANIWIGWTIAGTGDFNNDGNTDILWLDDSGDVAVWLMNGTALMSSTRVGNTGIPLSIVAVGDFNADGKSDILWRSQKGLVVMWQMDGATLIKNSVVADIWTGWSIVGVGDFNADGKTDILWLDVSGNVAIWFMDGTTVTNWAGIGTVADRIAQ